MRLKLLVVFAAALVVTSVASADITVNFSGPVNMVSFYSSEPYNLTLTDNNGATVTVNSGYGSGAVTPFADAGVTSLDFSGSPDFYVVDDLVYSVGGQTYDLTFDEAALQNCGCSVSGFYAGLPGNPVFSNNADILTYPNYNWGGYPYNSSPDVIYEGGQAPPPPPAPEPGSLALLGSGLLGLGAVVRRKLSL